MTSRFSKGAWPWMGAASCWILAAAMACRLEATLPPPRIDEQGVAGMIFGSSRRALSADLYERADAYFHKGAEHFEKKAFTSDWFQKTFSDIAPQIHRHAEGKDTAEIIPWLELATRADPHNVEAFLVTSFWLDVGLNRPDLADRVLKEAQRLNPRDYRVMLERGRFDIKSGQFTHAASMLDVALSLWPSTLDPADRQSLLDKAEMHTYRAFLHELGGRKPDAIAQFKNALEIFPERNYIRDRIAELESGKEPGQSAQGLLSRLVKRTTDAACTVTHENDDHEHQESDSRR